MRRYPIDNSADELRPVLPLDVERCFGFVAADSDTRWERRCERRWECARYLAKCGPNTPARVSACEGRDGFIPAHAPHDAIPPESGKPLSAIPRPGADGTASSAGAGLAA